MNNIDTNKNSILILLLSLLIIIPVSCKKGKEDNNNLTIISGTVKHNLSLGFIPEIQVKLVKNNCYEMFGVNKYLPYSEVFIIDTLTTNDEGSFEKSFSHLDIDGDYCVIVYNDSIISDVYNIIIGETNKFNIFVSDLGYLRLIFSNTSNEYKGLINEVDNYLIYKGCKLDSNTIDTNFLYGLIPGTCKITTSLFIGPVADTTFYKTIEIQKKDTIQISHEY